MERLGGWGEWPVCCTACPPRRSVLGDDAAAKRRLPLKVARRPAVRVPWGGRCLEASSHFTVCRALASWGYKRSDPTGTGTLAQGKFKASLANRGEPVPVLSEPVSRTSPPVAEVVHALSGRLAPDRSRPQKSRRCEHRPIGASRVFSGRPPYTESAAEDRAGILQGGANGAGSASRACPVSCDAQRVRRAGSGSLGRLPASASAVRGQTLSRPTRPGIQRERNGATNEPVPSGV